MLKQQQRVSHQLVHISDWVPSLLYAIGHTINDTKLNGHNIWQALSLNIDSPRTEVVHIDEPRVSYIHNNWKYVKDVVPNQYDTWLSEINSTEMYPSFINYAQTLLTSDVGTVLRAYTHHALSPDKIKNVRQQSRVVCTDKKFVKCKADIQPCLFDIIRDPCERNNLATKYLDVLHTMEEHVEKWYKKVIQPRNKPADPLADPRYHEFNWTWWYDEFGRFINGLEEY